VINKFEFDLNFAIFKTTRTMNLIWSSKIFWIFPTMDSVNPIISKLYVENDLWFNSAAYIEICNRRNVIHFMIQKLRIMF